MSDKINCVFCGEETWQKTIKFKSETLEKCLNVLEYRRNKTTIRKSRTTYDTVDLSAEKSLNEGYHAHCYKLFTAVKIPSDFRNLQQQQTVVVGDNTLEVPGEGSASISVTSLASQAGTSKDVVAVIIKSERDFEDFDDQFSTDEPIIDKDLEEQKCVICEKSRKRHNGREVPLSINKLRTVNLLKSVATEHNDVQMLEKISSFSNDSNISYHKCCKDQYLRDISRDEGSKFFVKRKASNSAFNIICEMLEEQVVKNNKCLIFDHVKKEYQTLLLEQSKLLSDSIRITTFSDRHLERKLMKTFDKKIKIIRSKKKKFLAPFSASILTYMDLLKKFSVKKNMDVLFSNCQIFKIPPANHQSIT